MSGPDRDRSRHHTPHFEAEGSGELIEYPLRGRTIVGVLADIAPDDQATLVHDKDGWRGPLVVEQVVDAVGAADRVVGVGQDGVGVAVTRDQGLYPLLWLYYQGNDLGFLVLKQSILGLQLTELRAARPSTAGTEKDKDHSGLASIIAQTERSIVGVRQRKVGGRLTHRGRGRRTGRGGRQRRWRREG